MLFLPKHILICAIALLLFAVALPAQVSPIIDNIIEPLSFSRIGVAEWASGGVKTVEAGSPTAAFNNPALLRASTLSVYVEFGKRSEQEYSYDSYYNYKSDGQFLLPNTFLLVTGFGEFNVALGYINQYDRYRHREQEVATAEYPDGTGLFFEAKTHSIIHTVTASASYVSNDIFSIGLTAGINIATLKNDIYKSHADGVGTGGVIIFGMYAKLAESFHIGSSLQLSGKIASTVKSDPIQIDVDQNISGNNQNINANLIGNEFPFVAEFPLKIQGGAKWDINPMVELMTEVDYTEWSELSSPYSNIVGIHLGFVVKPIEFLKIRGGYFAQNYATESTSSWLLNQKFWTAGIEWIMPSGISIMVGTSQNFSTETTVENSFTIYKEEFRQNLYLFGVLYQL